LALAASGAHVVLVDANLAQPRLPQLFGVEPRVGLSALLTGEPQPAGQALTATSIPRVWLIASGASEPGFADLLASRRMRQVIADLAETVDLVLVDGPSLALSDALALSASVSHVMLVVDPARTKAKQTRECVALVERSRAELLGLVLNRVSRPRRSVSPARAFAAEPRADRIHTSVIADLPDADAASRSGS
jgi:Mrp family chromosome partitioning ATPase